MSSDNTLGHELGRRGISRRSFLKYCTAMASAMALPPSMVPVMADTLANTKRRSVIWLSFQECTGCTESLTRSHNPTLENLIFDFLSLDYHHALQAASGEAAEEARHEAMEHNKGEYLVVVDGSIPVKEDGAYSTIAGISNVDMLKNTVKDAAAIISVGTCAAFGGIPKADPNPTGAVAVTDIISDKPVVNVSGCPPVPIVISGILSHFLTFDTLPQLDYLNRPVAFFGENIHDRCYRRPFYEQGKFAKSFDDEGARKGWCLYDLGCKAPVTRNACATLKWNEGLTFPIQSGHGCLGCSEPDFWDWGGFYKPLSAGTWTNVEALGVAAAAGAAVGLGAAALNRRHQKKFVEEQGERSGGVV